MDDYRTSKRLNKERAAVRKRVENANKYFALHPKEDRGKFHEAYEELQRRLNFLNSANYCLKTVTDNSTNMEDTLQKHVPALYYAAIDENVFSEPERQKNHVESVKKLRKYYPEQEQQIVKAIRQIYKAIDYQNTEWYWRSLRRYVEAVVEYYLWLHQILYPVEPPPKEQ